MQRQTTWLSRTGSTMHTRGRSRYRFIALLAALAMVLAACGGDENGDGDDGGTTDDGGTDDGGDDDGGDAASGDVDEITVWFAREYFVPPDLETFEEETGISVNVDVQPDDDLFQQLIRMNDAGQELPDIVHLDGFLRPVVVQAGVVTPIQDVVDQWAEEDPESYEQVYEGVWEEGMVDGELYGMANSASMEEVFFRNDWLEEAGVTEAPETWDEVLDAARAIQEVRPDVVPFGWWAARGNGANHVYSSMTAMGVEFDGSIPNLESDGGEYWINWVQTLAREGLLSPEAIAWNDDNMRGGFVGSNVGMMLDSAPTSLDARDADLEPGENFRLVPMPTSQSGSGDEGTLTAPARTFLITTDAEERGAKEAAGLFLRYLMERDVALEVMKLGGDPHRTAAVLEDPEAVNEWLPIWDEDNVQAFAELGVFPVDINFPSSQDVMERFNEFVVDNPDMDPAEVAAQWQAEFDAVAE